MNKINHLDIADRLHLAASRIAIVRAGIESEAFHHPRAPSGASMMLCDVIEELEAIAESLRPSDASKKELQSAA